MTRNENLKADENANHSKQTKDFLDKIASPRWIKQKKKDMLDFWKSRTGASSLEQFYSRVNEVNRRINPSEEGVDVEMIVFERDHINEEEVEEFDLKYPMYFSSPSQLVKKFEKLEEDNLALINSQQENQDNFAEEEIKFKKLKTKKEEMISQAKYMIEGHKKTVAELNSRVNQLKELAKEKKKSSSEDTFDRIENIILTMLQIFKDDKELRHSELGIVNKSEAKNKENLLKYLTAIERLLIAQVTSLREYPDKELLKKKKGELEADRRKQRENEKGKQKDGKKRGRSKALKGGTIEADEMSESTAEYLEIMRLKNRRRDMFKSGFADQEDEVEDNGLDIEAMNYQRYFMD